MIKIVMKRSKRKINCPSFYIIILSIVIILFISDSIIDLSVKANNNASGFSIELIHPNSPLLNPNLSDFERQEIAFEQIGSAELLNKAGVYLMKIRYGVPPVELLQLFDTGSGISWIQCVPCVHCFFSRFEPFNPSLSRTFKFEKCHSNRTCPYSIKYQGNSSSSGVLARDTITVGTGSRRTQIENFLFGCAHNNQGKFPQQSAGIIGFNPKEKSFITQLSRRNEGKFSFCMTEISSTQAGRIRFGQEAIVSGPGVVTTPLIIDSHYTIMLEGISVGNKKIKNKYLRHQSDQSKVAGRNKYGKMVVDSGSNMMKLPGSLYSKVEKLVKNQINETRIPSPPKSFTLCYSASLRDSKIPNITIHFPGVDLVLSPSHTFMGNSNYRCLAMGTAKSVPIFGNMAMVNFLVGFDIVEKKLSFKPVNCSTL